MLTPGQKFVIQTRIFSSLLESIEVTPDLFLLLFHQNRLFPASAKPTASGSRSAVATAKPFGRTWCRSTGLRPAIRRCRALFVGTAEGGKSRPEVGDCGFFYELSTG